MRHPICQVQQATVAVTESGLPCLTLELHGGVGFTFVLTEELWANLARDMVNDVPSMKVAFRRSIQKRLAREGQGAN